MDRRLVILTLVGAIILGATGFGIFVNYGGNNCDQPPELTCDCFCCDMFGTRGYEACGVFGIVAGIILGALLGLAAYFLLYYR